MTSFVKCLTMNGVNNAVLLSMASIGNKQEKAQHIRACPQGD